MSFEAQLRHLSALHASGALSWDDYAERLQKIETARAAQQQPAADRPPPTPRLLLPAPESSPYYAHIPEHLYRDRRMSRTAKDLVALLIRLARGRDEVDAFIDQLADWLACCRRSIQYAQRRAEACGYIAIQHVREGRVNDANVYRLLAPARPQGRPEPRRTRPRRGERRQRPRRRANSMGVQKIAPHEERSLKGASPSVVSPQGDERSAARRGATCGPSPFATAVRLPVARQGDGSNSVPSTGPP